MERRIEARIEIDQTVTVTVLGMPDSAPFQAVALEMSSRGMGIQSPIAVPYQAAVKVQVGDLILLGEVIRVQVSNGVHMLALKLRHSIDLAGDLNRLNDALHQEASRETSPASESYVRLR